MEIIGGIAILLGILVLFAALGVATIAAFVLMAVLGLVTELSFKKLFFLSFALGLLVPILLGGAVIGAIEEGSLEQDLRAELREAFPPQDQLDQLLEDNSELRDIIPPRDDLERILEERPEIREAIPPEVLERLLEVREEAEDEAAGEIAPSDDASE
jgi:hypothetical protein